MCVRFSPHACTYACLCVNSIPKLWLSLSAGVLNGENQPNFKMNMYLFANREAKYQNHDFLNLRTMPVKPKCDESFENEIRH